MTVEFIESSHSYLLHDEKVPSVTQVLSDCDLVDTTWYRAEHAIRGQAVHKAILYLLQGDLDESTIDPKIVPYIDAFKLFQSSVNFKPNVDLAEKYIIHKELRFGGTPDIPCELNGIPTLLDIKTGMTLLPAYGIQLGAYKILLRDVKKFEVQKRYVLQLKKDSTYRLHEFKDKNDERIWLSCLAIYNWKKLNGGKNGNNGS